MPGVDHRSRRQRLLDHAPVITGLTLLLGALRLVELATRLHSRAVECCPTSTARVIPPVTAPPPALVRTGSAGKVDVIYLNWPLGSRRR